MKKAAIAMGMIGGLLALSYLTGVVGIHYPRVIENQPLLDPHPVAKIEGTRIELRDGRIFEVLGDLAGDKWPISDSENHRLVDIEPDLGGAGFILYGNRDGWVCGTPWAKPIVIPIIGDDVYRNRREMIALVREITPKTEPNKPE